MEKTSERTTRNHRTNFFSIVLLIALGFTISATGLSFELKPSEIRGKKVEVLHYQQGKKAGVTSGRGHGGTSK